MTKPVVPTRRCVKEPNYVLDPSGQIIPLTTSAQLRQLKRDRLVTRAQTMLLAIRDKASLTLRARLQRGGRHRTA